MWNAISLVHDLNSCRVEYEHRKKGGRVWRLDRGERNLSDKLRKTIINPRNEALLDQPIRTNRTYQAR